MVKLPSAESVTGPASLRPVGPSAVADMSGLTQGVRNLASSAQRIVAKEQEKQNTIDLAAADAFATRGFLGLQNDFQQDGEYDTFVDRAESGTNDITTQAAELIRDPEMRQRWVAANEVNRIRQVDAVGDLATAAANEAERVRFDNTLQDYSEILADPTTPEPVREATRRSLAGTIQVAQQSGLYGAADADKARELYIEAAEQRLATNTADSLIRANPEEVISGMGIVANPDDPIDASRANTRLPIVAASGVNVMDVDPGVLTRYEQVQGAFGKQLTIISGTRDDQHNDAVGGASGSQHLPGNGSKAIDVDVSQLSKEERIRLIETASAMGFTGIGVYNGSLHFDTGKRRAWGPTHHDDSVPAWAQEAIDRHTGGRIAEVPVGTNADVDPRFAALSYEQRAALYDKATQEVEKRNMEVRASIETTAENAPAAIARSGGYDGYIPTANDFVMAYGARDGIEKYEAFDASVGVARDSFAMRTMSADEIASIVERAVPTDTGDGAALQEKSFAQISAAADATIKARADDPAGYVQSVYPAVAEAWKNVGDDPSTFQRAVSMTAMAQEMLGMPVQVLPKAMAANTATVFNDAGRSSEERMGALTSVVLATDKPDQQAAIYDQLVKAGVPPNTRAGMEALARTDDPNAQGAGMRLLMAAMAPPELLNKTLPGEIKPAEIDEGIKSSLFDTGQIGDIYYDLGFGATENVNAAAQDIALMNNSVKLRLLDGSAGGNVDRAIQMTVQDMFGDVQPITGSSGGGKSGLKVLLPKSADVQSYQTGFDALLGQVGDALARDLENDAGQVFGDQYSSRVGDAGRAILESGVGNYVEQALSSGYFTNAGDGFKFMDPNGRGPVLDAAGEPLIFSTEQVLAATATAGAVPAGMVRNPASDAGAAFGAAVQRPQ